jgi:NAD(P)-dependent dehydrogenase (short-subunit alcohol dehydrogenase family)
MAQEFLRSEDILEKYGKALAGKTGRTISKLLSPLAISRQPTNKVLVLITGVAETSIAGELAFQISAADPKLLILSARTKSHVEPIVKKIAEKNPGVATRFLPMDLSDLSAVRKAVQNDLSDIEKIDHVACVAGVMYCPYETTKDGFELQFGVNYVSNFLLSKYLLPKVEAAGPGSSINIVTSGAAKTAKVNLDGLYSRVSTPTFYSCNFRLTFTKDKETYDSVIAYSESNVDRVMFAKLLGQKLKSIGIRVHSIDPGCRKPTKSNESMN